MSTSFVGKKITDFLRSRRPEVFCIVGAWGVGKTYAWEHFLDAAQRSGEIGLNRYAYVSLFGKNSIDDVRTAIVENTVDSRVQGQRPNLNTLERVYAHARGRVGLVTTFLGVINGSEKYGQIVSRALYLALFEQIVCFDDLERAGNGLSARDVLGLASELCLRKASKVVLLLNQDALTEIERVEFDRQIEKIADAIVLYRPTSAEAVRIALNENAVAFPILFQSMTALDVTNIRVIKKAEQFCGELHDILVDCDSRILQQAITTIAVATYCKFQPSIAPPLSLLKTFNRAADMMKAQFTREEDPEEKHKLTLSKYGLSGVDELDLILIDGVEAGFFNAEALSLEARRMTQRLMFEDQADVLRKAWDLVRDSFDDNIEEVSTAMVQAVETNTQAVSAVSLDAVVVLLKEIGRKEQAQHVLTFYMANRSRDKQAWNLKSGPFGDRVADPDVRLAFETKYLESDQAFDPVEVLAKVGLHQGWNPDDVEGLYRLSVYDLKELFKSVRGEKLKLVVEGGLTFRSMGGLSAELQDFGLRAEEALRNIGSESALNARRVAAFGVQTFTSKDAP